MTDLAGRIADLSPGKRELLRRRLDGLTSDSDHPIKKLERDGVTALTLSYAQQRLWFLDQLLPGTARYNIYTTLRFSDPVNNTALERSLGEMVRRHESLRTTFSAQGGAPQQLIHPVPLAEPVINLSNHKQAEVEVRRSAYLESQRPFDLSRGPLLRASLLRLTSEEHLLVVVMHHIISDGWSMEVFRRELAALYAAYSVGAESPLAELPIQYADYAVWQREYLHGERLDAELAYWKRQLADLPQQTLPIDFPRPPAEGFQGALRTLSINSQVSSQLKQLAQKEGATLFMVLLAAFQTLLYRYTSQSDIVIGTPLAGRNRLELEGLIGFFVNTLVLRTKVEGDLSFVELVRRVREVCLQAYANQEVPFDK